MIPIVYLGVAVAYIMMVVGFYFKSEIILLLTGLGLLMPLAIYIFIYGLGSLSGFATQMFGSVTFGVGAYISIRSSMELIV